MRRLLCIMMAAAVSAGLISGCAAKKAEPDSSVQVMFAHPTPKTPEQAAADMQWRMDEFKKNHPDRFVNGQITSLDKGANTPASAVPAKVPGPVGAAAH